MSDEQKHSSFSSNDDECNAELSHVYSSTDAGMAAHRVKKQKVSYPVWVRELLEWVQAILFAVILGYFIKTFLFTLVLVDGASMNPTLSDGDRLFVYKLFYKPKAGDIVVFRPVNDPQRPYIKRVIATGGQEIDFNFEKNEVYVDGVLLDEPYILEPTRLRGDMSYPLVVDENCVFVMGDNRNDSHDSRRTDVGLVNKSQIMGCAVFRWWPLDKIGGIE